MTSLLTRSQCRTRSDFDTFYEVTGACPKPGMPSKWQYLPMTSTHKLHNYLLLLLWVPLSCILFPFALICNLCSFLYTIVFKGGVRRNALRSTQPRENVLIRWILSLLDIFNVTEIPKPWDEQKATEAFELFGVRNGFTKDEVKLNVLSIPDSVTKREVVHKYHKADRYPASLHRVWVLCAPSKTFICSATNFAEFDGTSCFNLVKALVSTYYDGEAPLVRSQAGGDLDLQLSEDSELGANLNMKALVICFSSALQFAICYGRYLLSREVFDMLACASPTVCTAIEWFDFEANEEMMVKLKKRGHKMFPHIMSSSAKTLNQCEPKVSKLILLTQVSCQSRYYKPTVPRNVCGNWLIGIGEKSSLDKLEDPHWCKVYYEKVMKDIKTFSSTAAFTFIAQTVYGFFSTGGWANPRIIYWFNNYGLRDMHKDAGGVTYHWGPNYGAATYCVVNVITVDGRTCITLLSSVIPQGELERAAALMKRIMIEEADGSKTKQA